MIAYIKFELRQDTLDIVLCIVPVTLLLSEPVLLMRGQYLHKRVLQKLKPLLFWLLKRGVELVASPMGMRLGVLFVPATDSCWSVPVAGCRGCWVCVPESDWKKSLNVV